MLPLAQIVFNKDRVNFWFTVDDYTEKVNAKSCCQYSIFQHFQKLGKALSNLVASKHYCQFNANTSQPVYHNREKR